MPDPTDLPVFIRGAADSLIELAQASDAASRSRSDAWPYFPVWGDRLTNVYNLIGVMSPDLARALAVQMRATADRHQPSAFLNNNPVWCMCGHAWPCPDIEGTAKVAEHVTQALGETR